MFDWASLGFNPAKLPLRVMICGFAPSRANINWDDPDVDEFWLVNDLYAHAPRNDSRCRTFELHSLTGLQETGRRNPAYIEWLKRGKHPVYMAEQIAEFPTSIRFPYEDLLKAFPRRYVSNSIAWMQMLAILLLTDVYDLPEETAPNGEKIQRKARLARPGAAMALMGIDMSADTEFGQQRPCCDHYVGMADAVGIQVVVPPTSDLCKSPTIYGLDTTAPLRQKIELKIGQYKQAGAQIDQQLANLQAQEKQLLYQKGVIDGEKQFAKYIRNVWTMGTDVVPTEEERAKRHGTVVGAVPSSAAREHVSNGKVPVETGG